MPSKIWLILWAVSNACLNVHDHVFFFFAGCAGGKKIVKAGCCIPSNMCLSVLKIKLCFEAFNNHILLSLWKNSKNVLPPLNILKFVVVKKKKKFEGA